jgi:antitoxin component of MazEF toxin-antitoxin module
MIKRLVKHGNSLALVIDKPILELLEIEPDTPLSITTDGTCLVVTAVRDPDRARRLEEALAKGNKRYAKALRRLAE